ncbi:hypothetical protein BDY21DRAFT_370945 [Lineolata rhizophorae]|uniref:Uncharacterized protein n=1 Tax=Lineolata rhizophorae TaxID=578093 RepID=A0A6A6P5R2_9PEZI|nr:hypothetical protein BDY21DRAFT_370945 [Lineolata rhizophorae]
MVRPRFFTSTFQATDKGSQKFVIKRSPAVAGSQFCTGVQRSNGVVLNSGVQGGFDFSKPASVDLGTLGTELTTNYVSYIYLSMTFPFFF